MNFLVVLTLEKPNSSVNSLALTGLQKLETKYKAKSFKSVTFLTLWRFATSFHTMESNKVSR